MKMTCSAQNRRCDPLDRNGRVGEEEEEKEGGRGEWQNSYPKGPRPRPPVGGS
jgi:hypothetical protein